MNKQAIKFLDPQSGRIGGYLVVWGSPEQVDLQGEYFTPHTDFALDWYEARPVLYHHGLDGEMKAATIGRITSLKADDVGIWAEAQLDMHKKYVQAVQKLVDKGVLNWSSGSLAHLVEVEEDGEIKKWPLVEGSLTPTPAEPRRTDVSTIKTAYKSLGLDTSKLRLPTGADSKEVANPKESKSSDDKTPTKALNEDTMNEKILALFNQFAEAFRNQLMSMAQGEMSEDDMKAVASEVEEGAKAEVEEEYVKAMEEEEDGTKSVNKEKLEGIIVKAFESNISTSIKSFNAKRLTVANAAKSGIANAMKSNTSSNASKSKTGGIQWKTNRSYGESFDDLKPEERQRKEALKAVADFYETTSDEPHLGHVVQSLWRNKNSLAGKAQNPYIGTLGGYLVGVQVAPEILDPLRSKAIAFQMGVTQTTIEGAQSYVIPKMTTAPAAFRPGINQEIAEDEAEFDLITGSLRPIAFRVRLPRQMLMANPDQVRDKIVAEGRRSIDLQIDKEIFIGEGAVTGSNTGAEIKGVLRTLEGNSSLSSSHIVTLDSNGRDLQFNDIVNAETRLANSNIPDEDQKALATNPTIRATLRKMTDANGQPLFRGDYSAAAYRDVLGYPLYTSTQLPSNITTGTNANTGYMFFGAWRYAEYLMSNALELIVDEYTYANQLMVQIIGYTFSDLVLHYPEAFYVMKGVNAS